MKDEIPRPKRRPPALALGAALAALGAVAYFVWPQASAPKASPGDSTAGEPSSLPTLPRRDRRPPPGPPADPFAPAGGPVSGEDARAGLGSRLEVLRLRALEDIVRRGAILDAETTKVLEAMAAGPVGRIRASAQAALMKVEGSRRFLRELAERAAASPLSEFYEELVKAIDPGAGDALLAAVKEAHDRTARPDTKPLAGLDDVIAALASDPKAGADAISTATRSADSADEPTWLDLAAAVKPVPAGVSSLMAERLLAGSPESRAAAVSYLVRNRIDLSTVPEDLVPALVSHLDSRDDPLRGAAIRALGRLGRVDSATIAKIVQAARDGEQRSFDALIALRNLGEQARPAARAMIDLSPSLSPTGQFLLAQALLSTGGDGVGAYAAERLAASNLEEHRVWLQGAASLSKAPDAAVAADAISAKRKSQIEEEAIAAIGAMAQLDRAGVRDTKGDTPAEGLAEALSDPRAPRRIAAAKAVLSLATLPPRVAEALAALVETSDPAVRAAAIDAIAGSSQFGAAAKPLVPAALALLGGSGPKADVRVGLLRTIGAAAPDDAGVRAALRAAITAPSIDERLAGIYGLSRVATPTPEERRSVAAAVDDPTERVRVLARSVFEQPAWR